MRLELNEVKDNPVRVVEILRFTCGAMRCEWIFLVQLL